MVIKNLILKKANVEKFKITKFEWWEIIVENAHYNNVGHSWDRYMSILKASRKLKLLQMANTTDSNCTKDKPYQREKVKFSRRSYTL